MKYADKPFIPPHQNGGSFGDGEDFIPLDRKRQRSSSPDGDSIGRKGLDGGGLDK